MSAQSFTPNERVLCYHGPLIYEAKVLKAETWDERTTQTGVVGPHYYVHYKGWKQTCVPFVLNSLFMRPADPSYPFPPHLHLSLDSDLLLPSLPRPIPGTDTDTAGRWDEWVDASRLLKFNETNIQLQKALQSQSQAAQAAHASSSKAKAHATKEGAGAGGRAGAVGGRKDGARGTKRGREEVSRVRSRVLGFDFRIPFQLGDGGRDRGMV